MVKLNKHTGNWAKCLAEMEGKERPATAKQGFQERIRQGIDADISKGSWFPENVNYVQGKVLWALSKYNPQIPYAEQAVQANRNGKYFQLTPEIKMQGKPASLLLLEIAEEDAVKPVHKRRVLDSKHKQTFSVPADKLGEVEEAVFLARGEKLAQRYGQWIYDELKLLDITNPTITFYLASQKDIDFSAGFWLCSVGRGYRSNFDGDNRYLYYDDGRLFGVEKSAKGTSQKIKQPSLKEIIRYSRRFVPEVARDEFEKGLKALLNQ